MSTNLEKYELDGTYIEDSNVTNYDTSGNNIIQLDDYELTVLKYNNIISIFKGTEEPSSNYFNDNLYSKDTTIFTANSSYSVIAVYKNSSNEYKCVITNDGTTFYNISAFEENISSDESIYNVEYISEDDKFIITTDSIIYTIDNILSSDYVIDEDDVIDVKLFNKKINKITSKLVVFTGATLTTDGTSGMVPAPTSGSQDKFLKNNGTWSELDTATASSYGITQLDDTIISSYSVGGISDFGATSGGWTLSLNDLATDGSIVLGIYGKNIYKPTKNNSANYELFATIDSEKTYGDSLICYGNGIFSVYFNQMFYTLKIVYGSAVIEKCSLENDIYVNDLIYADGKFVALGYIDDTKATIWSSVDGKLWEEAGQIVVPDTYDRSDKRGDYWYNFDYDNGTYVAVNDWNDANVAYSNDLQNWTFITLPIGNCTDAEEDGDGLYPVCVVYKNGKCLVGDEAYNCIAVSDDFENWNIIWLPQAFPDNATALNSYSVNSVSYNNHLGYLVFGTDYLWLSSIDGATWILHDTGENDATYGTWQMPVLLFGDTIWTGRGYIDTIAETHSSEDSHSVTQKAVYDYVTSAMSEINIADFTGATSTTDGTSGMVPAPTSGNQDKFLKADGTWETITITDTNVTNTLNTSTVAYITGTINSTTNTGTQIFDTGVYLTANAGELQVTSLKGSSATFTGVVSASSFSGNFSGTATSATNATNVTGTISSAVTATTQSATDSSTKVATTEFVKNAFSAVDAIVYKGTIAGSTSGTVSMLSSANKGDLYKVSTAGYIGTNKVEVGDMLICNTDSTASATVANWDIIQTNTDTFTGATSTANGTTGLVPAPSSATYNGEYYLKADGTWAEVKTLQKSYTATSITTGSSTTITSESDNYNVITISTATYTLAFTAAADTVYAEKLIHLTSNITDGTTVTYTGATFANNEVDPTWGANGYHLFLKATFVGGRVILNVLDNDQCLYNTTN